MTYFFKQDLRKSQSLMFMCVCVLQASLRLKAYGLQELVVVGVLVISGFTGGIKDLLLGDLVFCGPLL